MKIVIPMAGRGKRFASLGEDEKDYLVPKPMIRVFGKPMVKWAVESYSTFLQQNESENHKPAQFKDLIFICLREHEDEFQMSTVLKEIFSRDINIVLTNEVTRGPAETALLAKNLMDPDEDVLISDCDHHFDASLMWKAICQQDTTTDVLGILPLMKPKDTEPSWSYVVLNDRNEVVDIREKDVELAKNQAYGVIGAYYFRKGRYFVEEAEKMIREVDLVGESRNKEFYMSRIYQRMIQKGFVTKTVEIKDGWLLGTPKHLEQFVKSYPEHRKEISN